MIAGHAPAGAGLSSLHPERPLVVALRGSPGVAAASTLPSLRIALHEGAEMLALDLRPSAEGVVLVSHRAHLALADTGRRVGISDHRLDILRGMPGGDPLHLPALDDVLGALGREVAYVLILREPGVEEEVLALVHRHGVVRQSLIASGERAILGAVAARDACVPLGRLHEGTPVEAGTLGARWLGRSALREAVRHRRPFALLEQSLMGEGTARAARRRGIRLIATGVAGAAAARRLADWGLFGLMTEQPRAVAEALRAPG